MGEANSRVSESLEVSSMPHLSAAGKKHIYGAEHV